MKVHVCGIDIGKTVFHLVGLSKEGHIVTHPRWPRRSSPTFPRGGGIPGLRLRFRASAPR